jgi:hypothetical protein
MIDSSVPDGPSPSRHPFPFPYSSAPDIRSEMRAALDRLELLTLSLRRAVGDPYGRPIRPRLRLVASEPEAVPDER